MNQIETRPSAAHRWTKCSAAPLFASRAGPQPTSDAAREGTCAAWVAELMLTDQPVEVGMMHENGWEVDPDMIGHMQEYADICRAGSTKTARAVGSTGRLIRSAPKPNG